MRWRGLRSLFFLLSCVRRSSYGSLPGPQIFSNLFGKVRKHCSTLLPPQPGSLLMWIERNPIPREVNKTDTNAFEVEVWGSYICVVKPYVKYGIKELAVQVSAEIHRYAHYCWGAFETCNVRNNENHLHSLRSKAVKLIPSWAENKAVWV